MIQVYKSDNENYNFNGDMILEPTSCKINRKLAVDEQNMVFTLELEHKLDKTGKWQYLSCNAIIKAPTASKEQLFRIYKTIKNNYNITVSAKHVFFDLEKICVKEKIGTGSYGLRDLLDKALQGTKFTHNVTWEEEFKGDVLGMSVADVLLSEYDNCISENYVIDVDNYNIKLISKSNNIGEDKGFRCDFGYNLKEIEETIDYSDMCTRKVAYCTFKDGNDERKTCATVDSPHINDYPQIYEKSQSYEVNFDDESANEEDYKSELKNIAGFENDEDIPTVNYKVNIELLSRTTLFNKYKKLLDLQIGDIVHCRHSKLNITTDSRMISYEYDAVNKKYLSQELGDYVPNFIQLLRRK